MIKTTPCVKIPCGLAAGFFIHPPLTPPLKGGEKRGGVSLKGRKNVGFSSREEKIMDGIHRKA